MRIRCVAFLIALSACRPAPPTPVKTSTPRLQRPELPQAAHAVLRGRMHRHVEDTGALLEAMLYLDYERVETLAERVGSEPQLSKVDNGDPDLLNTHLPASFFTLQSTLAQRAQTLQTAAKNKDHAAMGAAFGALTETCVACHAAYLHDKE